MVTVYRPGVDRHLVATADFAQQFPCSQPNIPNQNRVAVFGHPYDVIFAIPYRVATTFELAAQDDAQWADAGRAAPWVARQEHADITLPPHLDVAGQQRASPERAATRLPLWARAVRRGADENVKLDRSIRRPRHVVHRCVSPLGRMVQILVSVFAARVEYRRDRQIGSCSPTWRS
jgi:hypothetical protein